MPAGNLQAVSYSAVPTRTIGALLISPITNVVYYIGQTGSHFTFRHAEKDRYLNTELEVLFPCRCTGVANVYRNPTPILQMLP
jgi:hypothetical protein